VESYVVENGKVRLAGRGGSEMDGINVRFHAERASNELLLVQGTVAWSSGHVLPAKAVLYRANATGVTAIWQTAVLGELGVISIGRGFVVQFHDEALHTLTAAPTTVQVYFLDGDRPTLVFEQSH